ncbi:hypothetical protein OHB26_02355 [Nocardia sp. NBC_01503]|uniref:hypothetical protein n=1 Tax=Nocardia sp. NBC_01503 TaxID=2975997 RepID=UPI002E7B3E53|nr:hypothetical protein [Nocardia sp. NBC_01503]WTL33119.1 hypothetical protein OHB26_02355 [Nocardia sp. NBC_01503]
MSMPGYGSPGPGRGLRSPVVVSWVSAVLGLVCVAAAIGVFLLYSGEHDAVQRAESTESQLRQDLSEANRNSDRRAAAQRAACDFAVSMATYDYSDMEKYRVAMLDGSTGEWRQTFTQNWPSLRSVMTQMQTRSKAGETHCGLSSLGAHNAEVLVYTTQVVTTAGIDSHASSLSTVTHLDEQADGRWLVSEMKVPTA